MGLVSDRITTFALCGTNGSFLAAPFQSEILGMNFYVKLKAVRAYLTAAGSIFDSKLPDTSL